MRNSIIIKEFKEELKRLGYSKGVVKSLPAMVLELLDKTEKEPTAISSKDIWEHYEYLRIRPKQRDGGYLSESIINSHLYAIKLFFNYWQRTERVSIHPMSVLEFPRKKHKERIVLSEVEISSLYESTTSLRDRALLGIYYGCGLRRSEGLSLNIKDISFKQQLLYVRKGKGSKRRVVPMSEKVSSDLKKYYIKERNQFVNKHTKGNHSEAFLLSVQGTRLSSSQISKRLKTILESTEIGSKISLHNLRHSIATHLLDRGMGVEYVRDFLGHKHLESTQIYTRVSQVKLESL